MHYRAVSDHSLALVALNAILPRTRLVAEGGSQYVNTGAVKALGWVFNRFEVWLSFGRCVLACRRLCGEF
ncbi:MAG: hypothetical protein JXA33_26010 [Anaerolineae bacterium]|nr:hypothetical protein [Anaerolineae bacterium]